MRGVAGLELEILRAKAKGLRYRIATDDPRHSGYVALLERGLLAETGREMVADRMTQHTAITPLGRVVLAASEPT